MCFDYYIFDFDNTLCNTLDASLRTYQEVFNHFEVHFDEKDISTYLGESLESTYSRLPSVSFSFSDFKDCFFKVSDEVMPSYVKIYDSALELLYLLKTLGKKTAIVTNKNRSTLLLILRENYIEDLFDSIITYDDVVLHKPNPEGIERCLNELYVLNKKKAVYIGDSLNDMIAARSAGIEFIGIRDNGIKSKRFISEGLRSISIPLLLSNVLLNDINKSEITEHFSTNLSDIVKRVISTKKKFRRGPVPKGDQLSNLINKIQTAMDRNEPIAFSIPFGAYKGWQVDAGNCPDWAEIFHLSYFYTYGQDIAQIYEPGVVFNYTYQDKLVPHISNRSPSAITEYTKVFSKLLKLFSGFNERIQFKLVAINELYNNIDEYYGEFIDNLFEVLVEFIKNTFNERNNIPYRKFFELAVNGYYDEAFSLVHNSKSSTFSKLQSGLNNYKITGFTTETDYTERSNEEKIIRAMISAVMIDAVDSLSIRRKFNKHSSNIQLVFDKRPSNSIFTSTTRTSVKSFWAGKGVILSDKQRLIPTVISQKEWIDIKEQKLVMINGDSERKRYKVDTLPVSLGISKLCKNYNKVIVLTKI